MGKEVYTGVVVKTRVDYGRYIIKSRELAWVRILNPWTEEPTEAVVPLGDLRLGQMVRITIESEGMAPIIGENMPIGTPH